MTQTIDKCGILVHHGSGVDSVTEQVRHHLIVHRGAGDNDEIALSVDHRSIFGGVGSHYKPVVFRLAHKEV